MKKCLLILMLGCGLLISAGCETGMQKKADGTKNDAMLAKVLSVVDGNEDKIRNGALVADKATGGLASIIASVVIGAAGLFGTINREIVARRRKKVILEAEGTTKSIDMVDQVASKEAKKEVERIVGIKA